VLDEALIALATEGGSALVGIMATEKWETAKGQFASLLGQGDTVRVAAAEERLVRSRDSLAGLSSRELERAAVEQAAVWRVRLVDLLEDEPETADELRNLVEQVRELGEGLFLLGPVHQHVTGVGHVQQAVQGRGVQVNTFGGQREPKRSE
jgi:hypothetical protein